MLHQGPQTHEQDDTVHQPNTMCVFTVSLTTYSGSSDIVTENCHLPFIPLFPFVWAPPLCSSLNVQLVSFMLVSAPLIMCNSCLIRIAQCELIDGWMLVVIYHYDDSKHLRPLVWGRLLSFCSQTEKKSGNVSGFLWKKPPFGCLVGLW